MCEKLDEINSFLETGKLPKLINIFKKKKLNGQNNM